MIGILAGMGPKSTAPFVEKVVAMCQEHYGARHDMDFPPMMIYSCPTPFYLDRPVDHAAMEKAILGGVLRLAETGTDYLAIPCNLAHIYFPAIQAASPVPVLNMVEETLRALPPGCASAAVLATEATLESGIYQQGLERAGIRFVHQPAWQDGVNEILALIKSGRSGGARLWAELLQSLARSAGAALIACTDLNAVSGSVPSVLPVIDSSSCLARAMVDRHYRGRRRAGRRPG